MCITSITSLMSIVWQRLCGETGRMYGAVCVLSVSILVWIFKLWQADLTIPFGYLQEGDAFFNSVIVKSIVDTGWYLRNPFLSAPDGFTLYDLPAADNLAAVLMRLLAILTSDYGLILNLYFLFTFPLTAVTALYVFRQFQVSSVPALVGSLLFAFLPYHFWRRGHIFLASYYLVPLLVMVTVWVCLGKPFFSSRGANGTYIWHWRRGVLGSSVCLLMASEGAYYPFFGAFFFIAAGLFGSGQQRSLWPLVRGATFSILLLLGVVINLAPTIVHVAEHGRNLSVAQRLPSEAEVYGLKISQLVLPATAHRSVMLAELKNAYNTTAPLINENHTASLGLIGSLGFMVLIGWLLSGSHVGTQTGLLSSLSVLNITAVLLATTGGFGALFAYFISPQIRAYNRISVYIAFFSVFAVMWLLDQAARRWVHTSSQVSAFRVGMLLLLGLGLWDQSIPAFVPHYAALGPGYASDAAFVQQVEAVLPKHAMVFQLPYVPFPENGPVQRMQDYAHFRAYLHSKTLRWSYGAMKGRPEEERIRLLAERPVAEMVQMLRHIGFRGIYIDRYGYADHAAALEAQLSSLLQVDPAVSSDGRLAFFVLPSFVVGHAG